MEIGKYIERLNAAIDEINRNRGRELLKIGVDSRALIRSRIINNQELADGKATGPYSDKKVPFYYYYNKSRSGGDAALRRAVDQYGPLISYREWRRANSLQAEAIDFNFTGAMLRDIVPRVENSSSQSTTLVLGPVKDRNKQLFEKHSRRFGSLIRLNQDEIQLVQTANRRRVTKVFNQIGIQ